MKKETGSSGKRMRQISRPVSFLLLAIVYVLAAAAGIILYLVLPFSFWLNLLLADIGATILTFIFSLIFRNASVYDPYWSVQPIVILVFAAVTRPMNLLRLLMLIAVCFWGVRLTANWAYTFMGLGHQDWRYTMLHEQTGLFYPVINFLGIHLFPTLVVYACVLPAVFVFHEETGFTFWNAVLFFVSIGAAVLQLFADTQMHRFRKNRDAQFNRHGLWKYSRHPNYLGEILMWWGIGLSAYLVMPGRYYLLFGALANTLMFLFVSIPMADRRQAKKPGFAQYKASTHMLIPIRFGLPEEEEDETRKV